VTFINTNYERLLLVQELLRQVGYSSNIHKNRHRDPFTGREYTLYKLNVLGSSEEKHELVKKLNPTIKDSLTTIGALGI